MRIPILLSRAARLVDRGRTMVWPALALSLLLTANASANASDTNTETKPPGNDTPGGAAGTPNTSDETAARSVQATLRSTFLESVTVAATRSQRVLKETPGQIDVIDAAEIAELGHTGIADLVRFTPGIYVDGDLTRLGANGFNIRGIGGNRVLTQIDGIPTAEQFDFGPLSITQQSLDVDLLASAEIVRSAGSALYGSDALGGVVSLVTRTPRSYLGNRNHYLGLRAGYDGRADETSESVVFARGNDRVQGSIFYGRRDGEELDNQGTAPNPIDRRQDNALLRLGFRTGVGGQLETALEWFDGRADTEVLSGRAPASPFASAVLDFDAVDRHERRRVSAEHSLLPDTFFADSFLWRAYWQDADTEQVTDELRGNAAGPSQRDGLLTFDQETFGVEAEVRKALDRKSVQVLTYGFSLRRDSFDQLRDRSEFFLDSGQPVPTTLAFPSKYFPQSDVEELGLFVQGELQLFGDRLRVVPGLRFDRYELDADQNDLVFLEGNPGTPPPADLTDQAVSPKLGLVLAVNEQVSVFAQYARGFRAPPMSDVNNGFTNLAGGYRTLANPDLQPETSDNFELGVRAVLGRASFSVVGFDNRYEDFIETVTLGFDPVTFLIEFQPQNVDAVRISGVELAGEARIGRAWQLRGAYTYIEGDNETLDEPLESIAPPRLAAGLRYGAPGGRWGAALSATVTASKDADDLPSDSTQFQAPGYEVFDLAAWVSLTTDLSLQVSVWNLSDETYWQWPYVRGQSAGSATIDRYTSPGRSFGAQLRYQF